jgi:hypothetical protein
MILAALFLAATLTPPPPRVVLAPPAGAACLHDVATQTKEQRDRSVAALGATRAINTAESTYSARNNGAYASREDLGGYLGAARYNLFPGAEIVPGFTMTLDVMSKGYWFEIVDKTDPCGFRYISNQNGLIFVAQPIQ